MVIWLLVLSLTASVAEAPTQTRPDFSGAWVFDLDKSSAPSADGKIVIAAMLGDAFVAEQDARALKLTIQNAGQTVKATYALDGSESRNLSPGDIMVASRASWERDKLVILSRSTSTKDGRQVTIETRRVMWIDKDGSLVIERTGTPATEVTPSRSVYRRAPSKKEL